MEDPEADGARSAGEESTRDAKDAGATQHVDEKAASDGAAPEESSGPRPIPGLVLGRLVYYVMEGPLSAGESPKIRPAVVVQVWDLFTGVSNLQVFTDGSNDGVATIQGTLWKTSRRYSESHEQGTWHWPERA